MKINYFLNFLKVSLECGGTSRDNCTYMQLGPRSTFTSSNEVCTYKVCQTNDKVCRIRLDFQVSSTAQYNKHEMNLIPNKHELKRVIFNQFRNFWKGKRERENLLGHNIYAVV